MTCLGIQMEMTAPVLVKIPEETKMWEPAIYTLSFLVPAAYQEKPPVPTNDKVSRVHPLHGDGAAAADSAEIRAVMKSHHHSKCFDFLLSCISPRCRRWTCT